MPVTDNRKQRAAERVAHRNAERTKRASEAMKQGPAEELDPGIADLRARRKAKAEAAAAKLRDRPAAAAGEGGMVGGFTRPKLRVTLPPRSTPKPEEEAAVEGETEGAAKKKSTRKKAAKRR